MKRTLPETFLAIFVALLLVFSWGTYHRSPTGMRQAVEQIPLPAGAKLTWEEVVPPSPFCLEGFLAGPCPIFNRRWDLEKPITYSELEALVKKAHPDSYRSPEEPTLDEQGYCKSSCRFIAQFTTDKIHDVEVEYKETEENGRRIYIRIKNDFH